MKHEEMFAKAISADMAENPSVVYALDALAKEGKGPVIDFLLADVMRGMRRDAGPVIFPHLRAAFRGYVRRQALGFDAGMGQTAPTAFATGATSAAQVAATPAAPTTDVAALVGSTLNTLITAGASIYNTRQLISFQKDQLRMQQGAAASAQSEAEAARMIETMRLQQAAARAPSAMPEWLLPVLIGGGVLAFVMLKR